MQLKEYENIYKQEDIYWWHKSLYEMERIFLKKILNSSDHSNVLLDAGCGTGGNLRSLKKNYPSWFLLGADVSSVALSFCRKTKGIFVLQTSVDYLPFGADTIDVVVCLDVLYHTSVSSDQAALKEIYRVVRKGGYVFVHLPAFEFLRSGHDQVTHTRERYTKSKLRNRMKEAGFEIVRCSYRHMFLFFFIWLRKMLGSNRSHNPIKSNLQPLPFWVNNILEVISCFENQLLRYINLPFGSSVLCLARKV